MNLYVNKISIIGYLIIILQLNFFITDAIKCGTTCKSCAMSCQKRLTSFRNKQSCILSCSPEFRDQKVSFVDPYWNCIHIDCLKSGTGLPKHIKSDDDWNNWDCPKNCLMKNNDRDHLVNINDIQTEAECDDQCRMCRFTCFVSTTRYAKDLVHKTSNVSLDATDMRKLIQSLRDRSIGCISSCEKCQIPCFTLENDDNRKRCWRSCCPSFSNSQTVDFYGPYYDCMSEQCFAHNNSGSNGNIADCQMPSTITSDEQFVNWHCQQMCVKVENVWKNEIIAESKVECNEMCVECQQRCDYLEFPYHRYACKEACSESFSSNNKLSTNFTINSGYYQCLHDKCFADKVDMSAKLLPTNDTSLPSGLDINFYNWKCRRNCGEQYPTSWREYLKYAKQSGPIEPEQEWKTIDDFWPSNSTAQQLNKEVDVVKLTKAQEQSRCQCIETELKIIKRQKFAKDLFEELENAVNSKKIETAVNSKKQKKIKPKKGLVIKEKHRTSGSKLPKELGKEIDEEIDSFNEKRAEELTEIPSSANTIEYRDTSRATTSTISMIYTELSVTTESSVNLTTIKPKRATTKYVVSDTSSLLTTIASIATVTVTEITTATLTLTTNTESLGDYSPNFNASSGTVRNDNNTITTQPVDNILENKENNFNDNITTASVPEEIDATNFSTSFFTTTESLDDIKDNADTVDEQNDENSKITSDEISKSNVNDTDSIDDSDQDSDAIKNSVDSVDDTDEEVVTEGKTISIGKTLKPMSKKRKRRRMRKNLTNNLSANSGRRKRRKKAKPIVNKLKSKSNETDAYEHKVLKEVLTVNITTTPQQFSDITESSAQNITTDLDIVNSNTTNNEENQTSIALNISITTEIVEQLSNTIDTTDANVTIKPVLNETELSVATINETALTVKPIDDKELKVTPINDDLLTVTPIDDDIKESADSVEESDDNDVENTTVNYSNDNLNNTRKIKDTVTSSSLQMRSQTLTTIENTEQITNTSIIDSLENTTDTIDANTTIRLLLTSETTESVDESVDIVTDNQTIVSIVSTFKTVDENQTEKLVSDSKQHFNDSTKTFTDKLLDTTTIDSESIEDKADVVSENDLIDSTFVSNSISGYTTKTMLDLVTETQLLVSLESEYNHTQTIPDNLNDTLIQSTTSIIRNISVTTSKNVTENETEKLLFQFDNHTNNSNVTTELFKANPLDLTTISTIYSIVDNADVVADNDSIDTTIVSSISNGYTTEQQLLVSTQTDNNVIVNETITGEANVTLNQYVNGIIDITTSNTVGDNQTEKLLFEFDNHANNATELDLTTIYPKSTEDKANVVVTENQTDSTKFSLLISGFTTELFDNTVNTNNFDNKITILSERIDADVVTERDIEDITQTRLAADINIDSNTVQSTQQQVFSSEIQSTEQSIEKLIENNADIVIENVFESVSTDNIELLSTETTIYKFDNTFADVVKSEVTTETVFRSVTVNPFFNLTFSQEMIQKNGSSIVGVDEVEKESDHVMASMEPIDRKTTNIFEENFSTFAQSLTTGEEFSATTAGFPLKSTDKSINEEINSDTSDPSVNILSLDVKYNQQKDDNEGENERKISDLKSSTDNVENEQKVEVRKYSAVKVGVKSDLLKKKVGFAIQTDMTDTVEDKQNENESNALKIDLNRDMKNKSVLTKPSDTTDIDDNEQKEENKNNALKIDVKSDLKKKNVGISIQKDRDNTDNDNDEHKEERKENALKINVKGDMNEKKMGFAIRRDSSNDNTVDEHIEENNINALKIDVKNEQM